MRSALLSMLLLAGCAPPMNHIGIEGEPQPLREEDAPLTDATSITIRSGALHARHELKGFESCGLGCALKSRSSSLVTLRLGENGAVGVSDEGALIERFGSVAGDTKHHTTWNRGWTGSWTQGDDVLRIDLTPDHLECQRTTDTGVVDTPCKPLKLRLLCEELEIRLDEPKHKRARVWQCLGRTPIVVGVTPLPWIFGIDSEVRVRDRQRNERLDRFYARRESPPLKATR